MDTLIDQIRASLADDASEDAHHAGVAACRKILAALDAKRPGTATPTPTPPPTIGQLPALAAFRMPRAQLLDFVIAKLQALQPEATATPALGTAITALRSLSLDQAVELGIAKLRTAFAPQPMPGASPGSRVIHLAPVPPRGAHVKRSEP